jgi:hypothetical protein
LRKKTHVSSGPSKMPLHVLGPFILSPPWSQTTETTYRHFLRYERYSNLYFLIFYARYWFWQSTSTWS